MRTRRKEVSDEAIMLGVLRTLQRLGPGFSLTDAGREVGLTAARLVQRFGGRVGLVRAVFEYWGRASLAALDTLTAAERPLAAFLHWMSTSVAGMRASGVEHSLSWLQFAATDPVLRRWYADHTRRYLATLTGLLERAISAGELRRTDAAALAEQLMVIANGALLYWITSGRHQDTFDPLYRRQLTATLAPHLPIRRRGTTQRT